MATQTYASAAAVDAALVALTSTQRASVVATPNAKGGFDLAIPDTIAASVGNGPTAAQLTAYAGSKQMSVLATLTVSHTLKDGSTTLTTKCDPISMIFLNSLESWSLKAPTSSTRAYRNLDGSSHQISSTNMAEFLDAVGAAIQSTFDVLASVTSGIAASPPTIKVFSDIDAAGWPTAAS